MTEEDCFLILWILFGKKKEKRSWARFSIIHFRACVEEIDVERTIGEGTNLPDGRPQTTWRRRGLEGQAGASDTHQIYERTSD